MSFILYLLVGFLSGMLGGMGMGGGTILIPALTIILGVEQHVAQATNLIAFLPMALFSLKSHKDSGLLKTDGIWSVIIPAVITSAAGGVVVVFFAGPRVKKPVGGVFVCFCGKGGCVFWVFTGFFF